MINQGVRPNSYYLATLPSTSPISSSESGEDKLWQSAERGNTVLEYQAYLSRFPRGLYRDIAQARIDQLQRQGSLRPETALSPNHEEIEKDLVLTEADYKRVQYALNAKGIDVGRADGVWGAKTLSLIHI